MDIIAGEDIMACEAFILRTADITEIFYFNSYDAVEKWEDTPERMVDGLMYNESTGLYSTAATWISNTVQLCDGNSAPSDRETTITKVEIRAYSVVADSCGTCTAYMRPVFIAGDGDTHLWYPPGSSEDEVPPEWSEWFDITSDTNAPATWTWVDVYNLGVDHWMVKTVCGNPNGCQTARIEIRVTWYDSVELTLVDSLDKSLSKLLQDFNLWVSYDIADRGIDRQPLNLSGYEIGTEEGGIITFATICFPLCFPLCFESGSEGTVDKTAAQSAQDKIAKIHDWMENHYNVKIEQFGACFDEEYSIADFAVESLNHPSNYRWRLSLEEAS